jgi:hypothetical protein
MAYHYVAQPQFWRSFRGLPRQQWASVRRTWLVFKVNPFDPRLGTHKIERLSAIFSRTVYAVVIEGDLRITFYKLACDHCSRSLLAAMQVEA